MWLFAVISMILEAIYFILLCSAYSDHDFSLVHSLRAERRPAGFMVRDILCEQLTAGGYLGIAMITGGIIVIGATTLLQNKSEKPHLRGILTALFVALVISITPSLTEPPLRTDRLAIRIIPVCDGSVRDHALSHQKIWMGSFCGYVEEKHGYLLLAPVRNGSLHAGIIPTRLLRLVIRRICEVSAVIGFSSAGDFER